MGDRDAALPDAGRPKLFYGFIIVVAAFVIQIAMFGPRGSFGVFFKPLIAEFGWSRALVSGAFSISTVVQGAMGIVMGSLTDRLGPRIVLTFCGLLVGTGYLLISQTNAPWQFYLCYIAVIGVGMGGVYVPSMSTIARWFVKRRNVMSGIVAASGGLGGLLIPPAVNWLISRYEWRNTCLVLGAVLLLSVISFSQLMKRDPSKMNLRPYGEEEGERRLNLAASGLSLREAVGTWQFWVILGMMFCFGYCVFTVQVHLVPHLTDIGLSAAAAASVLGAMGGGLLLGGICLGIIADKIGNRQSYIVTFTLILIGVLGLWQSKEVGMFYLFAVILGLGGGGGATITSTIIAEYFGMKSHGVILGIVSFVYTIGTAVGPFVAGYVFDTRGSYNPAFMASVALGVVAPILAVTLKPIKKYGIGAVK